MTTIQRTALLLLVALSCASGALTAHAQPRLRDDVGGALAIRPMTRIGAGGVGYLADPQPIHLAPSSRDRLQILSGTTKAIVQCAYPISPGCFAWKPLEVDVGTLGARIAAAGATVTNMQNVDLYQDDGGSWHAVVTIGVKTPAHPQHWTVTAHAHPTAPAPENSAPFVWSADTVLTGSFAKPVEGNYDGKYLKDGGRLYLLYVENIAPAPALRSAIVIQPMRTPRDLEPVAPTILLTPGDRDGPLASERYANTQAALVEAPYISRIEGKYALVYSSGAYLTPGYKAAVAWSDTLLPPPGGRYRKVLEADPQNIWGERGGREVRYLIQSQRPRWPNFTGRQVTARASRRPCADRGARGGSSSMALRQATCRSARWGRSTATTAGPSSCACARPCPRGARWRKSPMPSLLNGCNLPSVDSTQTG